MGKSSEILLRSSTYRNSHAKGGKKRHPTAKAFSFILHNLVFGSCFNFFRLKWCNLISWPAWGKQGGGLQRLTPRALWPHSTEVKARDLRLLLKKGVSPHYWIRIGSLGKQIFAFLWENRWTIPSRRMWFISLVQAHWRRTSLKTAWDVSWIWFLWQSCCGLKGGGMRLILIMADGGSTSYCNRPLKHDWKQISLKCASEYEFFFLFKVAPHKRTMISCSADL